MIALLPLAGLLLSGMPNELAHYDDLWMRRDGVAEKVELDRLSAGYAESQDVAKLWRATRWYVWLAQDEEDSGKKRTWAERARSAGERAHGLDANCVPCGYWTALGVGAYGASVGMAKAFVEGVEAKFRDPVEAAAASDPQHRNPDLDFVGPQKALGRYWYELPWPKRDLKRSLTELRTAVTARPDDLRAHYFLAETLAALGEQAQAKRELQRLQTGSIDYDPPEGRRVKACLPALVHELEQN